jgi:hypothetical protein
MSKERESRDLPVYHSDPWLRAERHDRGRKDTLREGEADFVVVDPSLGILILEVKGEAVGFDGQAHEWFRQLDGGRSRRAAARGGDPDDPGAAPRLGPIRTTAPGTEVVEDGHVLAGAGARRRDRTDRAG